jgi:hypothetical protein
MDKRQILVSPGRMLDISGSVDLAVAQLYFISAIIKSPKAI